MSTSYTVGCCPDEHTLNRSVFFIGDEYAPLKASLHNSKMYNLAQPGRSGKIVTASDVFEKRAGISHSAAQRHTGWTAGVRNFSPFQCPDRLLGPTQPPIQWESVALFSGVKRPRREAGHVHLVPRSGIVELYLHSLWGLSN
jgi:hypothetical protein